MIETCSYFSEDEDLTSQNEATDTPSDKLRFQSNLLRALITQEETTYFKKGSGEGNQISSNGDIY